MRLPFGFPRGFFLFTAIASGLAMKRMIKVIRDLLRTPRVVSTVKLIVTIVLLIIYLASGDIDGLLRFLVGSI